MSPLAGVSDWQAPAAVPFGLLAAVELLAVVSFLALAVAVLWPRLRTRHSPLFAFGALLLAAAEVVVGTDLGSETSDVPALLRCAGAIALIEGLRRGAGQIEERSRAGRTPTEASAVLAPLAAPLWAGWLATAALLVAAASAGGIAASLPGLRRLVPEGSGWRTAGAFGRLVGAGLLLVAAAQATAGYATSATGPTMASLLLRAAGGVCLLAALASLTRRSVLGRVSLAILAGVLATAITAASVAGTMAVRAISREEHDSGRTAAAGAIGELDTAARRVASLATAMAACPTWQPACLPLPPGASAVAWTVPFPQPLTSQVSSEAVLAVARSGAVTRAGTSLLLVGSTLVAVGHAARADGTPIVVLLPVDVRSLAIARTVDVTLVSLPQRAVLASTQPAAQAQRFAAQAPDDVPPGQSVVRTTEDERYVAFAPVVVHQAVLALVERDAPLTATERRVLAGLFLGLAAAAAVVGLAGVVLGIGVVRPVVRITAAARAIRGGDFSVSAGPGGPDELGELARAFDAMTTEMVAAQNRLQQTAERESHLRARLSAVLDAMSEGVLVLDATERVLTANPAACRLLGESGANLVGRRLDDLLGQADRWHELHELRRVDGVRIPVAVDTNSLPEATGVPGGRVVVLRDRSTEEQAERMKTQFLANISHELRTPLTPVLGFAELLRRRPNADVTSAAAAIATAGQRLARVVDLLVDVAALDAGRITPDVQALPVAPFLRDRTASWAARCPQRADDLLVETEDDLPAVASDPRWLGRAFDELIDNAVKFSSAGTPITLSAHRCGERVRLAVHDEGPGLDEAARARLFDDFAQLDGSATRSQEGLGLGLAFVRRLTGLIGAELKVDSTTGAGTTFALHVPEAVSAAG